MKRNVPLADVIILLVPGILFWMLGNRTNIALLQALGGVLVGMAIASFVVGFSPLHYLRVLRSQKKQ